MGDRFYAQQQKYRPKRRLKADVVKELQNLLGTEIKDLDRLTIVALEDLIKAVEKIKWEAK
jgi:hypothetical protein